LWGEQQEVTRHKGETKVKKRSSKLTVKGEANFKK